jgi:hypothetical protein
MFLTEYSMAPGELAKALEIRGFESRVGARAFRFHRRESFRRNTWKKY